MPSCVIYLVMGFSYTYLMFQFFLPYCHCYRHIYRPMIPIYHHLSIINVLAVDVTGFSDKQHLSTVVVFQPT